MDGSVKIWDGISSQCVATFKNAHEGAEVCSVEFSRNGKYVLSSGKDSMCKLWELSTTRCLIAYTGAGTQGKQVRKYTSISYFSLLMIIQNIWKIILIDVHFREKR